MDSDFLVLYNLLSPVNSVLNTSDSIDPSPLFSPFFSIQLRLRWFIIKTIKNYYYLKLPCWNCRCGVGRSHMWLEVIVGLKCCLEGFFPNTPVFSLSSKTNMFKLDMSPVKREHLTGQEKNDREERDLCRSPMRFLSRMRWCFLNIQ